LGRNCGENSGTGAVPSLGLDCGPKAGVSASSSVQKYPASPLARVLREQREAAATLPAAGGVLGVSDWVAEEVLLLAGELEQRRTPRARRRLAPAQRGGSRLPDVLP
jgi:hypothetical protein